MKVECKYYVKPSGKGSFERFRYRWKYNIKMGVKI
jgi:hypothetical protein